MRRKIALLLTMVILATSLVGCGSSGESKVEEIKAAGKIILGTAGDYPPYEFHKEIDGEDQIVGFDIEIAKAIAESMGVELEIRDMKFEGLLPALVTGDVDMVIAGMVADEERKQSVDFSVPYYVALQRFIVKSEDAEKLTTPDDFDGLKIGAQKSSIQEDIAIERFASAEYIGLSKITDLVLELKNSKIDGVVLAEPVAKAYVNNNTDLFLAEEILGQEDGVAVAIKKGNEDLVEEIDEILTKLIEDGSVDRFIAEATALADE